MTLKSSKLKIIDYAVNYLHVTKCAANAAQEPSRPIQTKYGKINTG